MVNGVLSLKKYENPQDLCKLIDYVCIPGNGACVRLVQRPRPHEDRIQPAPIPVACTATSR
jgi:hypothetical protein